MTVVMMMRASRLLLFLPWEPAAGVGGAIPPEGRSRWSLQVRGGLTWFASGRFLFLFPLRWKMMDGMFFHSS